jgi:rare lipoprotein A
MNKYILYLIIISFITGCATREENIYLVNDNNDDVVVTKTHTTKHKLKPYKVLGKWYYPRAASKGEVFRGIASWYGPNFHGKKTANGEIYNMYDYTAANKILPLNTKIKVINLNNNKSVVVRVNDRGPFVENRIVDLSYVAGKKIGLDKTGIAPVKIIVLSSSYKYSRKTPQNHKKNGKIKIQIGAFKKLSGAKIFKKEFSRNGKKSYIQKIDGNYKVFIGNFNNYKEAKRFKIRHNIKGFIIDSY